MSEAVHWKLYTNPNYLGGCHFTDGQDKIVTIKSTVREMVIGEKGRKEECTVMYFVEKIKPLILNKTNAKTISKLFKSSLLSDWDGRKIQLYYDPTIPFAGEIVGGIRVRNFIPTVVEENPKCIDCKQNIQPFGKMNAKQLATHTQKNYGKALCSECATKLAELLKEKAKGNDVL